MPNSDVVAKGFPQADGAKQESVLKHYGPASYTQVTPGTTPTGGDSVTAVGFGLKYIEALPCVMDNTGTYVVCPIEVIPGSTWLLRWFTAASMVEVTGATNLNASYVKLRAIGY